MKKLFVAVLAIAGLVACNNEPETVVVDSQNKSVAITIANANDDTRAAAGTTTPATANTQAAVANATDLKILFAAGDVILKELPLVGEEGTHNATNNGEYMYGTKPAEGINGDYFFHNVPASVTKVAIVRYETGDITIVPGTTKLADVLALAESTAVNETREIDDVCLYGDAVLTKGDLCVEIDGVKYYVYPASVTVESKLARLEINNIECYDLGDDNDDNDLQTIGIDELTLKTLAWGAGKSNTIDLNGVVLKGSFDGVNNDVAVDADYTDRAHKLESGKVWSWNFAPEAYTNIELTMDAKAHTYQLPNTALTLTVKDLEYNGKSVKSEGYKANNIYQLDLRFSEDNIGGQEGVCVDVTVTIVDWTVNVVKPIF
jgi:hypothetical protein